MDKQEFSPVALNSTKSKKGFKIFGFSQPILKAIYALGYKYPTPIQKAAIPFIVEGKDILGMARTGSGKTGTFLLPIIDSLKAHSQIVGLRALVLSPTRELALQTYRFAKSYAKFTDLRFATLVGGQGMDSEFDKLAKNPDIVIGTPGRIMHHLHESPVDLSRLQHIVYDEADTLFEMGFAEQLSYIAQRVPSPDRRQTLLFSATLPKVVADFALADLKDPEVIRLDVEDTIPEQLDMHFFVVRKEEKPSALLWLLEERLKGGKTIVFCSTWHHVEFLTKVLQSIPGMNKIGLGVLYGKMDMEARNDSLKLFRESKEAILFVTDVAARGLDVPDVTSVVNYDFPDRPKLYVHRVGRAGRAGRKGVAYSFASRDETPYLLDLFRFAEIEPSEDRKEKGFVRSVDQRELDERTERIERIVHGDAELPRLQESMKNGYSMYSRSRVRASKKSLDAFKEFFKAASSRYESVSVSKKKDEREEARRAFLGRLSGYKPKANIFETLERKEKQKQGRTGKRVVVSSKLSHLSSKASNEISVNGYGGMELPGVKSTLAKPGEFFIGYQKDESSITAKEEFLRTASGGNPSVEFLPDELDGLRSRKKGSLKWDRKKKRFIRGDGSKNSDGKMIKTESGTKIRLKDLKQGGLYDKWKNKTKRTIQKVGEKEREDKRVRYSEDEKDRIAQKIMGEKGRKRKEVKDEVRTSGQVVKRMRARESESFRNLPKKVRRKERHGGGN